MDTSPLAEAVFNLAHQTNSFSDSRLDHPWAWNSYDSEGIRFAFFRTYEELRQLAIKLRMDRQQAGNPPSSAQFILSQYHAAYLDLQASLLGLNENQLMQPPAEGEWAVRTTLAHMVGADIGFYVLVRYALDQHRGGTWQPAPIPDSAWTELIGLEEDAYHQLMEGPVEFLQAYHQQLHRRILDELAGIREDELDLPSVYWEAQPMPVRFRLHRFDSHLRQHTIQVDKTVVMLNGAPNEARRLLRMIYAALADVEGVYIGIPGSSSTATLELTSVIQKRTLEITSLASLD